MKLPVALIIGKSLERLTEEKLNEWDLAKRIAMNYRPFPRDDCIRDKYVNLELVEALYMEYPSKNKRDFSDANFDKITVYIHKFDGDFPNCVLTPDSEDKEHLKQNQAIITESSQVTRQILGFKGNYSPFAWVTYCSASLFPVKTEINKSIIQAFVREVFSNPRGYFSGNPHTSMENCTKTDWNYSVRLLIKEDELYSKTIKPTLESIGFKVVQ